MTSDPGNRIVDDPVLRERTKVFRDRNHAGEVLSRLLFAYQGSKAIIIAIPAGGVPVGAVLARRLSLPLDVAVVSKITPSWDTEVGYGAVGFDGSLKLNDRLVAQFGLGPREIQKDIEKTLQKVRRRARTLRGERDFPPLSVRPAILVDDGLASGVTMRVAVELLSRVGAKRILVAVPTGHRQSVEDLARDVEAVYCANVRSGYSFAVADAYEGWCDIDEGDLIRWLGSPPT